MDTATVGNIVTQGNGVSLGCYVAPSRVVGTGRMSHERNAGTARLLRAA
jgi:Mycobacterium membrane protein